MGPWHPWTCVLWSLGSAIPLDTWTHVAFSKLRSAWNALLSVVVERSNVLSATLSVRSRGSTQRFRLRVGHSHCHAGARGLCQLPPSTVEAWDAGPCAGRG